MRLSGLFRGRLVAATAVGLVAAAVLCVGPAQAAIPATSCVDLNGSTLHFNNGDPAFQFTTAGSSFVAGQRITVTASVGIATVSLTGAVAVTFTGSTTFTVPSTGAFVESVATSTVDTNLSFTCTGGASSGAVLQSTINAQVAVFNGQQSLRSFNDWVSKTIVASFSARQRSSKGASAQLETLSGYVKVKRLQTEEREISNELADLRTDSSAGASALTDAEYRLAAVKQSLMYARTAVQISRETGGGVEQASAAPHDSRSADKMPEISLGTSDAAEQKWNVWLEGRAIGATDSVLQNNVFGFNGSGGADYKLLPWLAAGLSVGVESYETKFGTSGTRAGTVGLSVMPYVGVRLSDNVTASAFAGVTQINYNTNPSAGISARFDATRLMLGGALTGVWREENWRFQPGLSGAFGGETQNAYVDSQGNTVAMQTLYYGRVSAGPEIGYVFADTSRNWTIEPFVTARLNVDFSSQPATVVNGTTVILRAGTQASGALGAGAEMRFAEGFYVRAQGAYESLGITGLDIWTAILRGGMSF